MNRRPKIKKHDISNNPQSIFWVLIEARKVLADIDGNDEIVDRIDWVCRYQCKDYDKYISRCSSVCIPPGPI